MTADAVATYSSCKHARVGACEVACPTCGRCAYLDARFIGDRGYHAPGCNSQPKPNESSDDA